jgi:hypothetical protein
LYIVATVQQHGQFDMLVAVPNDILPLTDEGNQEIKAKMVQIDKDISEFKVMLVSYQSKVRRILLENDI